MHVASDPCRPYQARCRCHALALCTLHFALTPVLCTVCCAWSACRAQLTAHSTQCVHKRCPWWMRAMDARRPPLQLASAGFNVSSQPAMIARAGYQTY